MVMSFGKYKGRHVGWVIRYDYSYFTWMKKEKMTDRKEFQEAIKYVNILNNIPFECTCWEKCKPGKIATKYSMYINNPNLQYYCDDCNPYSSGAISGKLYVGYKIEDLARVSVDCNESIKQFTTNKGLKNGMRVQGFDSFFAKYK